jgi:rfaE bifunctional protein nucleotidyltransferase chain/domain
MGKLSDKIVTGGHLARIAEKCRKSGGKTVLCFGAFDLIHPGHIRFLKAAKRYGDILIVAIPADRFVNKGPGRPIFRQELRAEVLSAFAAVDYVTVVDGPSAAGIIASVRPDFYVKGHETDSLLSVPEPAAAPDDERALAEAGGKLVKTDDEVSFSSSKLIESNLDVYPAKTKAYLEVLKRKYSADQVLATLKTLKPLKILILGEAIIDQYYYCRPMGKSSKEPVMVNRYLSDESFIGGVLATANHTSSLSDDITLVTILGKKRSFKRFIVSKLRSAVKPVFFVQQGAHTIVKRRFVEMDSKQKLFQISYLDDRPSLPVKLEDAIMEYLTAELPKFDLVIVNDFGHGMFTEKMITIICDRAKYVALNVQANSANYGFNVISKYRRADFVCIDDQEIRLATHDRAGDLEPQITQIFDRMGAKLMVVTKGPKGTIAYTAKDGFHYAPALSDRIVDRVGAGDALFAVTSPCAYAGLPVDLVSFVANVAGALKTQVVGNRSQIEFGQLQSFISRLLR